MNENKNEPINLLDFFLLNEIIMTMFLLNYNFNILKTKINLRIIFFIRNNVLICFDFENLSLNKIMHEANLENKKLLGWFILILLEAFRVFL